MCLGTIPHISFIPKSLIIFDWGISAPGHDKEVVDGITAIDKRYMYKLISTVQLTVSKIFEKSILMHSCTPKKDASLAKEFQKHLSKDHHKHGVVDQVKCRKYPVKEMDRQRLSCSG